MKGPNSEYFLGAAIVSFESEEDKIKALSIFERSGWLYKFFGFGPIHTRVELLMGDKGSLQQLWLEKAFAPQDIIWEHLGYGNFSRFYRLLASLLLSLVLTVLIFFIILTIRTVGLSISGDIKKRSNENNSAWKGYATSSAVAIVVLLIDYFLQYLFYKLSRFERHSTITVTERNVTRKIWGMQLVASGLIPAATAILLLNWYGSDGLLYTIHLIFLSNLVLTPIFIVFGDLFWYYKKYQQYRVRKFITTGSGKMATQEEANAIWLKFYFNLSFVYSLILKNLALAAFFATIFPIGILYCVLQMAVYYWCFKFILVNVSNKLRSYSERISRDLLTDLEMILLVFILGMVYEDVTRQLILIEPISVATVHIVLFAVVAVLSYFGVRRSSTDFLREKKMSQSSFYQMKIADPNSYHLSNPATFKTMQRSKQPGNAFNQMSVFVLPNKDLTEIKQIRRADRLRAELDDKVFRSEIGENVSLKL